MTVTDRFLRYVSFDTQSNEFSDTTPSNPQQMALAITLLAECKAMGLTDVSLDANACLMATLPANTTDNIPAIGFIAHLDTSPDVSGKDVKPRIVRKYDGSEIVLNKEKGIMLSPRQFPELSNHKGEDLIVTDGTTLLGADDKAGIAEIMTAIQFLIDHPTIKHGKIGIAFTPDEEIGRGAAEFDVERFGCQWAYTVDGGEVGELEYENFNAATASIFIKGLSVHPGHAKNKMINAVTIAAEFITRLPPLERPEYTAGYEGFFHVKDVSATVDSAAILCIIRDHDRKKFEKRKEVLSAVVEELNMDYPASTISIRFQDEYFNMRSIIEKQMHIVELAQLAMIENRIVPDIRPIRGGTDGALLSYKGLPCPNIFSGGLNIHGQYEYIPVQSMEKAVKVIVKIAELAAKR